MILMPDLLPFVYVPNWYSKRDMLAEMIMPELLYASTILIRKFRNI